MMFLITRYPCINSISIFILDSKSSTRNFLSTSDVCLSDRNLLILHHYCCRFHVSCNSEGYIRSFYITLRCFSFNKSVCLAFFKTTDVVVFFCSSPRVNNIVLFVSYFKFCTFHMILARNISLLSSELTILHHKFLVLTAFCLELDRFCFYISLRSSCFC